jgi:hypothetical protein
MSFKLFDQGYTTEEIKSMKRPNHDEVMMGQLRKWKESEHVLNILRTIKSSKRDLDKMEMELWQKATRRR